MSAQIVTLLSIRKLYEQSRVNGLFISLIVLLCNIKFGVEIPASQNTGHVGFSELFILLGLCFVLRLVYKKQYVFTETSRKIFLLTLIASAVFIVIAGYHVLLNNRSVYEFIGVFRNIYGCMVLFFLIDARILKKEELVSGFFCIAVLYSLSVLSVVVYNAYLFDLHQYESFRWGRLIIFEDDLTILGALMVMCLFFVSGEGFTKSKLAKTVFILASALISAAASGSRSQATPIMVLFILLPFVFIYRNGIRIIRLQILSLLVAAISLVCISMTCPNQNYLFLEFFRGNPFIIDVVSRIEGGKRYNTEELAKKFGMGADDLDKHVSVTDLMYHGSSSAARSSVYRVELLKADLKILADSPVLGTGQRVRSQTYLNGQTHDFYTPPNFMLHISLLAGIPSILGYLALVGFIFVTLIFTKNGLFLYEKLVLLGASMPIFGMSMFHDGLAGGALLNFTLWLIVSYMFLVYKERVYGLGK
ncbi:O-antigen ligase family protein [Propionivibrio soli]|uniref:O-antigen ligase family protein n=1 Tax=Propionivibrio soli TaxID=2976531 RepID=UPI0021E6F50A|nr:O-antigen ligase family protein [Propionivibrio soli]